jgi:uncharacterized membrane protein YdfJ with MMPL/SSD domain
MGRALYRVGRFAARHRVAVFAAWLLLAVGLVATVHTVGAKTNNDLSLPGTDSQRATDILAAKFPPQQNGTNPIVFHVDEGKLTDPANERAMDATFALMKAGPHVHSVSNPVGKNGKAAGILSDDERTGIMPVLLDIGSGFVTVNLADAILEATEPARTAGIDVAVGGSMGSTLSAPDTKESAILGNVAAMVILALVFGSLVAMGTPIVTAIFALSAAISMIGLLGHVVGIPSVGPTIATMIGLGVGIDYALFLVTAHLDQLGNGMEVRESIAQAVSSSGSAIVFAGGTVVIALLSLSVAGIPLVSALGLAAAVAVLCAVVASITLLPAILSLLGHGILRLRIPGFLRFAPRPPGQTRWDAWARGVTRHPWITIAVALALLAPLIVPLFSLRLGQEDVGVTPTSTTERQAYDLLTDGFGVGYNGPLLIAIELDPPAHASAKYTKKYDEATSLQQQLEREQQQLTAQANQLKAQQAALEKQQRQLERQQASLERRGAAILERQAALQRQEAQLRAEARALAGRAVPLVARLAFILERERFVQHLIDTTTDPDRLRRLRARLARLHRREANVRARLATLRERTGVLRAQAERLLAERRTLQAQARALTAQEDALLRQAAALERQANALQAQADQLQQEQAAAKRQKKKALTLQDELTQMLTLAGGDPRGTDPRILGLQGDLAEPSTVDIVSPPQINDPGDAAILNVIAKTAPSAPATARLVGTLRDEVIPPDEAAGTLEAFVGGSTASNVDLATKIGQRFPLVIATVIALAFLLLLLAFRSLLVPVQAAVTNLLSVAAALGVLTATFQWGWGLSAIGLDTPSGTVPIASYVPLIMFAVLFGLSMDYEVFLVSRIQAHHREGSAPDDAVTDGTGAAAPVVTAAALIMFCVFASFIVNGDPTVKQFGVGLAIAVTLAGILIVTLAPAVLRLFGSALFRLPRALDRVLPHLDVEGGAPSGPEPEAALAPEAADG